MSKEKASPSDSYKQLPEITQRLKSNKPNDPNEPQAQESPSDQLKSSEFPRYLLYRFWNFFCILVISFILIPHSFQVAKVGSTALYATLTFVLTVWIYSQYIIELYAIYMKNLSAANIALNMMGFNAFFLLVATGYLTFKVVTEFWDSSGRLPGYELVVFIAIALSLICITHIFISFWGAMIVKDALIKRQASIKKANI